MVAARASKKLLAMRSWLVWKSRSTPSFSV